MEARGGVLLRQREGGQRKQLGQAEWRWGRKERHASILFELPGEANTNKQHRTAQGGAREGKERRGEVERQSMI